MLFPNILEKAALQLTASSQFLYSSFRLFSQRIFALPFSPLYGVKYVAESSKKS